VHGRNTAATTTSTTTTSTTLEPVVAIMVRLRDFQAIPETVTIKRENAVTWMNDDPVAHNIAFDDFSSGPIHQGEMYTHVFNETGTYHYYCSIHKRYMTGTVIVE
jgi:plastocyanin